MAAISKTLVLLFLATVTSAAFIPSLQQGDNSDQERSSHHTMQHSGFLPSGHTNTGVTSRQRVLKRRVKSVKKSDDEANSRANLVTAPGLDWSLLDKEPSEIAGELMRMATSKSSASSLFGASDRARGKRNDISLEEGSLGRAMFKVQERFLRIIFT